MICLARFIRKNGLRIETVAPGTELFRASGQRNRAGVLFCGWG